MDNEYYVFRSTLLYIARRALAWKRRYELRLVAVTTSPIRPVHVGAMGFSWILWAFHGFYGLFMAAHGIPMDKNPDPQVYPIIALDVDMDEFNFKLN